MSENNVVEVKQDIEKLESEIVGARQEVLDIAPNVNSSINKDLLKTSLTTFIDYSNQLKKLENDENMNVKKFLSISEKAVESISELLKKDEITDEERKEYVAQIDKLTSDAKSILEEDMAQKKADKRFKKGVAIGSIVAAVFALGFGVFTSMKNDN